MCEVWEHVKSSMSFLSESYQSEYNSFKDYLYYQRLTYLNIFVIVQKTRLFLTSVSKVNR